MLTATQARAALKETSGSLDGAYYSVGVEVPPRRGSTFSMRYTTVPNVRVGVRVLKSKLRRKRVGMVGELIIARGNRSVSLGGFVRRSGCVLEPFTGDVNRGALVRDRIQAVVDAPLKRSTSARRSLR